MSEFDLDDWRRGRRFGLLCGVIATCDLNTMRDLVAYGHPFLGALVGMTGAWIMWLALAEPGDESGPPGYR